MADPAARPAMARFGINVDHALGGISLTTLRTLARELGRDHRLAAGLWRSGIHEARLLACLVDDPAVVTAAQMDRWAAAFDSWDLCDTCCGSLFDRTPYAWAKATEWAGREEEFVKRAGFALMAWLAVHDKQATDERFLSLLPIIEHSASDDRNFVKKAVNWALRQIGKRNATLRRAAIETAERIGEQGTRSARWIASDALRELRGRAGR